MINDLEKCVLYDGEQKQFESKKEFSDPFPKGI